MTVYPVISRYSSAQDLIAGLVTAAANRGQPLRLLDAWRPVPELATLNQQDLVAELTAHLPPAASPAHTVRSRAVWQCTLRTDPDRAPVPDHRVAEVARRILAATGIAAPGDPAACRWVLIRTDPHEARIVAPLARADQSLAETSRDRSLALAVCQLAEHEDRNPRFTAARSAPGPRGSVVAAPPAAVPQVAARPLHRSL
ncbi:hypothetical protein AB0K51_21025 [Kitasatospora sp. NPDC049285]|uniref:hypothetical protein n=1 Tax=Kitasatospora sp. NPDC049285 TaxID=3157096 RepID=UPI00342B9F5F